MKKLIITLLIFPTIALAKSSVTIKSAIISCIRYSDKEQAELFFWSSEQLREVQALIDNGYRAQRPVMHYEMCGSWSPIIEIDFNSDSHLGRSHVMRTINSYVLIPEDSLKIWETDLIYIK